MPFCRYSILIDLTPFRMQARNEMFITHAGDKMVHDKVGEV